MFPTSTALLGFGFYFLVLFDGDYFLLGPGQVHLHSFD